MMFMAQTEEEIKALLDKGVKIEDILYCPYIKLEIIKTKKKRR